MRVEAKKLAQLLRGAPIVVAHTGAGLSTAAGESGERFFLFPRVSSGNSFVLGEGSFRYHGRKVLHIPSCFSTN